MIIAYMKADTVHEVRSLYTTLLTPASCMSHYTGMQIKLCQGDCMQIT